MNPSNTSLAIGATLGFLIGVLAIGYFRNTPENSCRHVAKAFEATQREFNSAGLRGTKDEAGGLTVAESMGISVAAIVSDALGVSCTVTPETTA